MNITRNIMIIIIIVLFTVTGVVPMTIGFESSFNSTIYVDSNGEADYETIQEAIDAANEGDTIFVYSGTYIENVLIDKTIDLIGEDKNTTIIDGNQREDTIKITEKEASVNGFTIKNSDSREGNAGVAIRSDGIMIKNNVIMNNRRNGISLFSASNCTITLNIIDNNRHDGIHLLDGSNYNEISDNLIINHTRHPYYCRGIHMEYSSNNNLINNILYDNAGYDINLIATTELIIRNNQHIRSSGIFMLGNAVEHYNTHTLDGNTVDNKPVYYYTDINTFFEVPTDAGQVILANCSNVLIQHLSIHDGDCAILLGFSNNNIIRENTISNVIAGIWLSSSSQNKIIDNTIYQVGGGIPLAGYSHFNEIKRNIISDNWEYGMGIWDGGFFNSVTENIISNNAWSGIILRSSHFNSIQSNSIENNSWSATYLISSSFNRFIKNNIIGHESDVYFEDSFINTWSQNYWDNYDGTGPMVLPGKNTLPWNPDKTIDWNYYDWRPSLEPYPIKERIT